MLYKDPCVNADVRRRVERSDAFVRAAEANQTTDYGDQYMRLAITFDTSASRYARLTPHLFVAAGRFLGTGRIEYAVHRVA
jgi:hypothetical protein